MHKNKEVIKEQPSAVILSATVRMVLQGKNVANQKPPFWSGAFLGVYYFVVRYLHCP
jgi:hypothetical protein